MNKIPIFTNNIIGDNMRNNNLGMIFIVIILIFGALGIIVVLNKKSEAPKEATRIRIIASSDSKSDQELKHLVKNKVIAYLKTTTSECSIEEIREIVGDVTDDYQVEKRIESFPAKAVNDMMIPSGAYQTIVITLGEGKGHNWWSLLYPEYFGLTYGDFDEIEYRSYIYDKLIK